MQPMPKPSDSKKRGRPAKYVDGDEKKRVKADSRRAKRQQDIANERTRQHDLFYSSITSATTAWPLLPPALPSRNLPTLTVDAVSTVPDHDLRSTSNDDRNEFGFSDLSLGLPLPPPSPLVAPTGTNLGPDHEEALPECDIQLNESTDDHGHGLSTSTGTGEATTELRTLNELHAEDAEIVISEDPGVDDLSDHTRRVVDLARRLTDQLMSAHGCCHSCHAQAAEEHQSQFSHHVGLASYLDTMGDACPHLLHHNKMATPADDLIGKTSPALRRQIFSGLSPDADDGQSVHLCLRQDERPSSTAALDFDIDSVTGFPRSLAVAKEGIRWHPTQQPISDLQASLHLSARPVYFDDNAGHTHQVRRPVHQIPHYTFGRLVGFEDVSLYLLFPHLYRPDQQSSRLLDRDFEIWMDRILLPTIYEHHRPGHVQHYPSSYHHSRSNATARGVETRGQRVDVAAREQQLMSFLPPDALGAVWHSLLRAVEQPGHRQFRDVTILLQAKNLKVLTKDTTWGRMMDRFRRYWRSAVDETYLTTDCYFDIATEICPIQMSCVAVHHHTPALPAETLLWKRCCLESARDWLYPRENDEAGVKDTFYPLSLCQDSGSLTIESKPRSLPRSTGLLYTQYYASVKEIFAAGNVYPFTNTAIETLALDPSLRRAWELAGGGLSHNPVALVKAYLYTKLRCHFALQGSVHKSFGIRSEHRVSRELFDAIDQQFVQQEREACTPTFVTNVDSPYYSFTSATFLRWLRYNINKFCYGFEMVHSFQNPHFVTWEHTRMMLMFLRCLQFSCPSGLVQKAGGCWQDVREEVDARQPNGLRRVEGLGFRRTMPEFGYAWFLDKIDWVSLTFRPPFASYMMFNNPAMQSAYRARYGQVRDVRLDYVRMDRARQWMMEFSAVPSCLELLEQYLRQLCLCVFRKDVFSHVKHALDPESMAAALAGEVPLCHASIEAALKKEWRPLQLAHGHRLAVKSMDVMFSWLWEWKDDQFDRKGWNDKPYRMLFRQSFYAIVTARGQAQARHWRQEFKKSFLRSHWVLPYPQNTGFMRKDKDTKAFVWWPSWHQGVYDYYERFHRQMSLPDPLPTSYIKHHPGHGWQVAPGEPTRRYMPYVVQPEQRLLSLSEDQLYHELVRLRDAYDPDSSPPVNASAPVLEFNVQSSSQVRPAMTIWCQRRREWRPKRYDEIETSFECSLFVEQELEKFELLQHQGRRRRRARKEKALDVVVSASESEGDQTSDEEGLRAKRGRQGQVVKRVEARMRELMQRERQEWLERRAMYRPQDVARWRDPHDQLEKRLGHRLRQVTDV